MSRVEKRRELNNCNHTGYQTSNPYREVIHLLHQRYHEAWLRAESLQDELDNLRFPIVAGRFLVARNQATHLQIPSVLQPSLIARSVPYEIPEGIGKPRGRVNIIIPFKDRLELLRACLRSLSATQYLDFDITLVNNGSSHPKTLKFLKRNQSRGKFRVVDRPGEFNFSRLCNAGAAGTKCDFLLFLNNDTEVIDPNWLESLMAPAMDAHVGAVGATLLYPNSTVQHAGIFPRDDGLWVHQYRGCPADYSGEVGELLLHRSVPAVTAACLLIRREVYSLIGGFDERYPVAYNDIDLCERLRKKGLLVIVSPHARLLHYEGLSRGFTIDLPR